MGYDSIAVVENPPLACEWCRPRPEDDRSAEGPGAARRALLRLAAIMKAGDRPDLVGLVYITALAAFYPGRKQEPARRAGRLNRNLRPHLALTEIGLSKNSPDNGFMTAGAGPSQAPDGRTAQP
jgi:hypothetical protein